MNRGESEIRWIKDKDEKKPQDKKSKQWSR